MKVVVYSGSNCPNCTVLKSVLNRENILYEEREIFDYIDEVTKLNIKSIPSAVIYKEDGSVYDMAFGAAASEKLIRDIVNG